MALQKGFILGKCAFFPSVVRFNGIRVGHVGSLVEVYNSKLPTLEQNLGLAYTNGEGYFVIPFLWDDYNEGDGIDLGHFSVVASTLNLSLTMEGKGQIHTVSNISELWTSWGHGSPLGAQVSSGVLELSRFRPFLLASGILTAFTPQLSIGKRIAYGVCVISD